MRRKVRSEQSYFVLTAFIAALIQLTFCLKVEGWRRKLAAFMFSFDIGMCLYWLSL